MQPDGFDPAMRNRQSSRAGRNPGSTQPAGGDGACLWEGLPQAAFLSVSQVAARLQVSSDTVLGWIRSGGLRAIDVTASGNGMRRHFRITEEALQEFLGSREVRCSPSPRAAPARRRRETGSEQEEPIKDYFPG
jgi:excisionase family DNA binding protein